MFCSLPPLCPQHLCRPLPQDRSPLWIQHVVTTQKWHKSVDGAWEGRNFRGSGVVFCVTTLRCKAQFKEMSSPGAGELFCVNLSPHTETMLVHCQTFHQTIQQLKQKQEAWHEAFHRVPGQTFQTKFPQTQHTPHFSMFCLLLEWVARESLEKSFSNCCLVLPQKIFPEKKARDKISTSPWLLAATIELTTRIVPANRPQLPSWKRKPMVGSERFRSWRPGGAGWDKATVSFMTRNKTKLIPHPSNNTNSQSWFGCGSNRWVSSPVIFNISKNKMNRWFTPPPHSTPTQNQPTLHTHNSYVHTEHFATALSWRLARMRRTSKKSGLYSKTKYSKITVAWKVPYVCSTLLVPSVWDRDRKASSAGWWASSSLTQRSGRGSGRSCEIRLCRAQTSCLCVPWRKLWSWKTVHKFLASLSSNLGSIQQKSSPDLLRSNKINGWKLNDETISHLNKSSKYSTTYTDKARTLRKGMNASSHTENQYNNYIWRPAPWSFLHRKLQGKAHQSLDDMFRTNLWFHR